MRGKTAKRLRRMAQSLTIGRPDRSYSTNRQGARRLNDKTGRATYQQLKKLWLKIQFPLPSLH